jgi:hypothetical protein
VDEFQPLVCGSEMVNLAVPPPRPPPSPDSSTATAPDDFTVQTHPLHPESQSERDTVPIDLSELNTLST